jgi:hypothetical protein
VPEEIELIFGKIFGRLFANPYDFDPLMFHEEFVLCRSRCFSELRPRLQCLLKNRVGLIKVQFHPFEPQVDLSSCQHVVERCVQIIGKSNPCDDAIRPHEINCRNSNVFRRLTPVLFHGAIAVECHAKAHRLPMLVEERTDFRLFLIKDADEELFVLLLTALEEVSTTVAGAQVSEAVGVAAATCATTGSALCALPLSLAQAPLQGFPSRQGRAA